MRSHGGGALYEMIPGKEPTAQYFDLDLAPAPRDWEPTDFAVRSLDPHAGALRGTETLLPRSLVYIWAVDIMSGHGVRTLRPDVMSQ